MKGWIYILECSDKSFYTGSTNNIDLRLEQHKQGFGSNHTKKRLPVKLVYFEEFERIDDAFIREKQIQGWSKKKKEALINGKNNLLNTYSKCTNMSSHLNNQKNIILCLSGVEGKIKINDDGFNSCQPSLKYEDQGKIKTRNGGFDSAQPPIS